MGALGKGFGGGVAFVSVYSQDHCAFIIDVAGELGGRGERFVETIGGKVLVGAGVGVIEINGVRKGKPSNRDTCHGLRLCL